MKELMGGCWMGALAAGVLGCICGVIILGVLGTLAGAASWYDEQLKEQQAEAAKHKRLSQYPSYKY